MFYIILILLVIPIISKSLFWFYVLQLKEYRLDRFKEYILTPQGKRAIFNKIFLLEITFFIISILLLFSNFLLKFLILFSILLLIENIIYLFKFYKKDLIIPDFTRRMKLLIIVSFTILLLLNLLLILINFKLIYFLLFVLIITPYLYIFIANIILSPIVKNQKNKIYKKAINKSNNFNDIIKIGITGSYGKSSIKEILSCFLESEGKILKTPKNINTEMGVSKLIIDKLSDKYKYFIAELGAYRLGEISLLGKIVNHKYGFLTAIGNQHIGLFGNQSNIIKAKKEICESIEKNGGTLYVNWDNDFIRLTKFNNKLKIVKYGFHKDSDIVVNIIDINNGITNIKLNYKGQEYLLGTNLFGDHNILNLSGVLAFCLDQGISINSIKKNILDLKLPKDTCEVIIHKNIRLINDTYNLSVDGLKSGIKVLNSFDGDKLLVVDDILELGVDSEVVHYDLGKYIGREEGINKILLCGVNYKDSFIDGLLDGGFVFDDIITDLDYLNLNGNTTILFAGKKAKIYFNKIIKHA